MKLPTRRSGLLTALVPLAALLAPFPAAAGEVTDAARRAEQSAINGDATAAISQWEAAAEALWKKLPLHFRAAGFAEAGSIKAFGKYEPRGNVYRSGEALTIYLEPVGYGFLPAGTLVAISLTTGLEIRSPGGIVFARAPAVGRLTWTGRARSREVHGNITIAVPDLKPGTYEAAVTLTDAASGKSATTVLPFEIAG